MLSLKEVRTRIASVKSTQQITSAMKMVAASKLRKAQKAILQMRPFAARLKVILQDLTASLNFADDSSVFTEQREPNKVLLILVSSNRGLCGAFNANVIKAANNLIETKYNNQYQDGNLSLITIGKKVSEFYGNRNFNIIEVYDHIFDKLTFESVSLIAEKLMNFFAEKEYDRIEVVYNKFKNAATQILSTEQYLPIKPVEEEKKYGEDIKVDYIFEPSKEEVIQDLIPKSLKIQLYNIMLESFAAEHGARMTAMHLATDNAQELIKNLNLTYNKARQAAITNEILEIVSGAEALKG
ncbi:MAG: ATP synthase F1 subunit gamma [Bacteroidales bacterium]|nr:ATP synthase F1 subunit gamma [Bacteroidales bacterium]